MSERRGTKALELWCRRITEGYPGVKIDNMTTSWRDGLAFCAMIHHFRPELIDFDKLNKSDVYYNNALAFTTAEKYLGIPALLDADDMAAYEVPDRLSILTYLSQFYQVFAAQEAHNRLKRSSSSATDETQITKSSGPPSKMAHVVGVPKREPCRRCQLPVFLAERLMVDKKVYHRTCLKCARCGYQLTPGSFYETEVDEQYCCETCPDEEVAQKSIEQQALDDEVIATDYPNVELLRSIQSSKKECLTLIEVHKDDVESGKNLLQKSLSDEDKSKSLQGIESYPTTVEALYKPNVSLTNFLNNTVGPEEVSNELSLSIQKSNMETSDSEDDTNDITTVSLPPELPKSLPPLKEFDIEEKKKRFSVTAQLVLTSPIITTCQNAHEQQNLVKKTIKKNQTRELQINLVSSTIDNTVNNNNDEEHLCPAAIRIESSIEGHQTEEETVPLHEIKVEDNLAFNESNDNDCITKEKADELILPVIKDPQRIMDRKDIKQSDENQTIKNNEYINETFAELTTNRDENSNSSPQLANNTISERLSIEYARLQPCEVIRNKNKEEEISFKQTRESVIESGFVSNQKNIAPEVIKNEREVDFTNIEIETEIKSPRIALYDDEVPLTNETKDIETIESNVDINKDPIEENNSKETVNNIQPTQTDNSKITIKDYPDDLNPFNSDEDDEVLENNTKQVEITSNAISAIKENLNPFDSSDDEVELEKLNQSGSSITSTPKIPPPRPPPPRISKNPFESEDEDVALTKNFKRRSSLTGSYNKKTPVPTPRSNISQSQDPTPETTPRFSTKLNTIKCSGPSTYNNSSLRNSSEFYGSANSLYSNTTTSYNILRSSDLRSSNNSLNLSAGGTIRSRKSRRAPLPPAPVRELFPSNETINISSKTSTPSSSVVGTPKSARKKRPAPAPPKPARLEASQLPKIHVDTVIRQPKNLDNYPLQSELDSKLSDEEKALLEGKTLQSLHISHETGLSLSPPSTRSSKRLIPLDKELLEEHGSVQCVKESNSQSDDLKQQNREKSSSDHEEDLSVVYRRILVPQNLETPTHEYNSLVEDLNKSPIGERQMEKLKDNKEANNRNRQSQISVASSGADDNEPLFNKSAHGKWKRRKGPAPALPIPQRKVLQMLPLQEIKHELEIIEVQQQGLEKQGVILEKMIRDRCEGENGEPLNANGLLGESEDSALAVENSKEVESLILQLFELVNEKNELFRRQAELMYLRRQHRLEQEQADLEYEIRILMAQPERNKTDSDKAREEALIERLVEVVQLRNEVIECLEMDRLREAEEDQSIKQRLESHIAKRDAESNTKKSLTKLSKKEKKKQKEPKRIFKSKKLDADKDADESELNGDKQKSKKKKKLLIF